MECHQAQELFSEYIDKRLDSMTSAPLDAHLAVCAECRVRVEGLERMNKLFAAMLQVEPPLGFQTRVLAHVQEQAAKPKLWGWLSLPFQMGVPIQATAVVLVAVLAVFLYQQERPLEQRPTTPVPMPDSLASKSEPTSAPPPVEPARKAESDAAPKLALQSPRKEPAPSLEAQPTRPLADPLPRKAAPPAPSAAHPFGVPGAPIFENREYARAGGEAAPDYRLTLRLHVQPSMRKEEASADRAKSLRAVFASLSEDQARRLDQARQRAIESGQAQHEVLEIARDRYGQFRQDLASMGTVESVAERDTRQAKSDVQSSDLVTILVTLMPPAAPNSNAPAQPGAR